jgi:diguanylate cyclase (GGDEF)-like protein
VVAGPGRITFFAGGGLVLVAWGLAVAGLPAAHGPVVGVLAEMLACLTVILAWRYRRSRLAVTALMIAMVNWLIRGALAGPDGGIEPGLEHASLAILLPLNLAVLALLRDRPLPRLGTLIHLAAVAAQPALVALTLRSSAGSSQGVELLVSWLELIRAPQAWLMAHLVAVVVTAVVFAIRRGSFEGGLLWVLVASALSIVAGAEVMRSAVLMAAAQLVLLVGLFEDSYRLAFHDELTGLRGRRALNDAMRSLEGRFAIAMVDVDHFKRFNDRHGHDAGDQVLRMVSEELGRVGGGGRAFRYGGEEFAVVFAGRTAAEALQYVEATRQAIAARSFVVRSQKRPRKKPKRVRPSTSGVRGVTITVSVGVAGSSARRPTPDDVLRAADRALYRAKGAGRNRVIKA